MKPIANLIAIPHKVSNILTTGLLLGAVAVMGGLIYEKHVLGNPFKIYRDEDGVFKFMSKEQYCESKFVEYGEKLKENPTDEGLQTKVMYYGTRLSKLKKEKEEKQLS